MPQVSVIVPVYNNENELPRCIDSVLAQTYRDFELILVDDGSPDRCPQICDEYAARDSRVRVVHKQNAGRCAARNDAIDAARSPYIVFLDGDDAMQPEHLQILMSGGGGLSIMTSFPAGRKT